VDDLFHGVILQFVGCSGLLPTMKSMSRAAIGWLAIAVLFFVMATSMFVDAVKHTGPGTWKFGGETPGTGGRVDTPQFVSVVAEKQYKRNCVGTALVFTLFGAVFIGLSSHYNNPQ
jgi:hypothetical protein